MIAGIAVRRKPEDTLLPLPSDTLRNVVWIECRCDFGSRTITLKYRNPSIPLSVGRHEIFVPPQDAFPLAALLKLSDPARHIIWKASVNTASHYDRAASTSIFAEASFSAPLLIPLPYLVGHVILHVVSELESGRVGSRVDEQA